MSMFAKIMVVVNFILAVVFLSAAGTLLSASEDWKARYNKGTADLQKEVAAREAIINKDIEDQKTLAQKAANAEAAQKVAETRSTDLAGQLDSVTKSFNALVASFQQLSDAQKDQQARNTDLNTQLNKSRDDLAASETAKRELEAKNKSLSENVAQCEAQRDNAVKDAAAKETRLGEVANQLEQTQTELTSYKKNFPHIPGGGVMKSAHGVVQAVDNRVDVYILSIGSKDGVAVGYEFTVFRGSEYVARVVVDKVWDNMASAHTIANTRKRDIQAGDEVSNNL